MKKTQQKLIFIFSLMILIFFAGTSWAVDTDGDGIEDAFDNDTIYGTISGDVQEGITVNIYIVTCGVDQPHGTATTDAQGYYAIGDIPNGWYLVVPEETGYSFTQGHWINIPQTIFQSYDFTAAALSTYGISGTVSGDVLDGVDITLSGDSSDTTNTVTDGTYSFTGLVPGNYTITASDCEFNDCAFIPSSKIVELVDADVASVDFFSINTEDITPRLPDTGQTGDYTATFGEDSDYGPNGHSYTYVGSGIVRDNVTGLEWQQSTVSGITSLDEAIAYCNGLTRGDHFDWRLPTVKELSTLVDSSIPAPGPCIDTTFFPDTEAGGYWSSTSHDDYPGVFWVVGFDEGDVHDSNYEDFKVRAVRSEQLNNNFTDNSDNTVTDISTGLMWQQATAPGIGSGYSPDQYTWEQALSYCEGLELAGHSDWRLPNRNELQSILNYDDNETLIDNAFFPDMNDRRYWSSTTNINFTDGAWTVDFEDGHVTTDEYEIGQYVRAVRSVD